MAYGYGAFDPQIPSPAPLALWATVGMACGIASCVLTLVLASAPLLRGRWSWTQALAAAPAALALLAFELADRARLLFAYYSGGPYVGQSPPPDDSLEFWSDAIAGANATYAALGAATFAATLLLAALAALRLRRALAPARPVSQGAGAEAGIGGEAPGRWGRVEVLTLWAALALVAALAAQLAAGAWATRLGAFGSACPSAPCPQTDPLALYHSLLTACGVLLLAEATALLAAALLIRRWSWALPLAVIAAGLVGSGALAVASQARALLFLDTPGPVWLAQVSYAWFGLGVYEVLAALVAAGGALTLAFTALALVLLRRAIGRDPSSPRRHDVAASGRIIEANAR